MEFLTLIFAVFVGCMIWSYLATHDDWNHPPFDRNKEQREFDKKEIKRESREGGYLLFGYFLVIMVIMGVLGC